LKSIGFVESKRETKNKISIETRYYINSIPGDAKQFAEAVRGHWAIENKLHWVLDVNFKEDSCRIRTDNAPENFAIIKHMAVNLIRKENSKKRSINTKRRLAGWDNEYLSKVITQ
jgi:predicted transposase YbfD/YdcC